ncbi:hypothetical protein JPSP3_23810 [Staphylococcus pseudintermedius]
MLADWLTEALDSLNSCDSEASDFATLIDALRDAFALSTKDSCIDEIFDSSLLADTDSD